MRTRVISMTDGETRIITLQVFCSALRVTTFGAFGCSLWVIQGWRNEAQPPRRAIEGAPLQQMHGREGDGRKRQGSGENVGYGKWGGVYGKEVLQYGEFRHGMPNSGLTGMEALGCISF